MLGLTKKRRQASMWESGPSGKRRARLFAVHQYRKSGPRKTAFTGLRKKTNDCRYIDDAGACTSRRRPAEEVRHPSKESGGGHGESTERARRGHGKATKDRERVKRRPGAPQKSRPEGERTGWRGGERTGWRGGEEPAGGGGKNRLEGGGVPIEVHEHKKTGALIGRRYVAR